MTPFIFILAIISLVGWGIGDVFGTVASRKLGGFRNTYITSVVSLFLVSVYIPFALPQLHGYTFSLFILNILISLVMIYGSVMFNVGLEKSNVSIVGTLAGCFTVIPIIFGVLFFHEHITIFQIISIILILLGISIISFDHKNFSFSEVVKDGSVGYGLAAMFGWGLYFSLMKPIVNQVGWYWPGFFAGVTATTVLCILNFFRKKNHKDEKENFKFRHVFFSIFFAALFLRGGDFAFNAAIGSGLVSIVSPIAGAYPILFVVASSFYFKEKLKKNQMIGTILALTGIFLISFS